MDSEFKNARARVDDSKSSDTPPGRVVADVRNAGSR